MNAEIENRTGLYRTFGPKIKLTFRKDGARAFFGPGIAELLDLIEESGSVKEACRKMGMSYSKGRHILEVAEKALGLALTDRQHGGAGGGGATVLTAEGHHFLNEYRAFEKEVVTAAEELYRKRFLESEEDNE
jgi:molybdate transport system regulatory protein